MKALIDADILLYRIGFTTEGESEAIAQFRMQDLINDILHVVGTEDYALYLSDGRDRTFRARLNPEYKANRTQPKPQHYEFLKKYLIDEWGAEIAVEEEADDLLGKNQTEDTIICSIDKDLLQIPGMHYNFVKQTTSNVSPEEGLLWFYKQLVIGDTADNIPGIKGIGPAKASKRLDSFLGESEERIFQEVREMYREWLEKEWGEWGEWQEKQMDALILMAGQMLKIRTKEGEVWRFPECNSE